MLVLIDGIIFSRQSSGGISKVWFNLLLRLRDKVDLESIFYKGCESNIFLQEAGGRIKLDNQSVLRPFEILRSPRRDTKQKFIFHSTYYRISRQRNALNIITFHDFTFLYYFSRVRSLVWKLYISYILKRVAGIVCISESTKRDLLKFFPSSVNIPIKVIYNGVDSAFLEDFSTGTSLIEKYRLDVKEYLLYVGSHKPSYKNFQCACTVAKESNRTLVVIGGGELSNSDQHFIAANGIAPYIKHLVSISTDELRELYDNALCLLYPSLYEGFGIPVLEAQLRRCPVITFNNSSMPEVNLNEEMRVSTKEDIVRILNKIVCDESFREQIVENGYRKSRGFTWESASESLVEFYQDVYMINGNG